MPAKELNGEGRLPHPDGENSKEEVKETRDISHIDQQEGNMHLGETGGNFNKEEKSGAEKNPR